MIAPDLKRSANSSGHENRSMKFTSDYVDLQSAMAWVQPEPDTEMAETPMRPPMPSQKRFEETEESSSSSVGSCICCGIGALLFIFTFPLSLMFYNIKILLEFERAVIIRAGRLVSGGARGPGLFFYSPCVDEIKVIDQRTVSLDIPPQEILSKDNVSVRVDAVIYFRVYNAVKSVVEIEDYKQSTSLLTSVTLRDALGTKKLCQILGDRDELSQEMQNTLDKATDQWGVRVERVELKDVRLPIHLQRSMAAEAEASRTAKAKVIAAEGEQKASVALAKAADIMAGSESALQLRYLQTMNTIAGEKNSTILFPLPIDLLAGFT